MNELVTSLERINLLLVDDHQMVIEGIKMLLKTDAVIRVVAQANAGDEALVIEKRYINAALAPQLLDHNLAAESIHETMISMGVPLQRVEQNLEAVNLRQEEAELLRVPIGTAAFLLRRTTYSGQKRASYVNYWVRGDRYAFQDTFEP